MEQEFLTAFRQGLSETGYREGKNLVVEYRWAEGRYDRLPSLAAELVSKWASAGEGSACCNINNSDRVHERWRSGERRPCEKFEPSWRQCHGLPVFSISLGPKRLEVLRELLPKADTVGFLVNPSSEIAENQAKEVVEAARSFGQQAHVLSASTAEEIEQAFLGPAQRRAGALLMSADLFFQVQRDHVVALAARHSLPVMYEWPEFVRAGGLISYSTFRADAFIQSGIYVGRIFNGGKPADLPVVQSTKFELTINLKTAGARPRSATDAARARRRGDRMM